MMKYSPDLRLGTATGSRSTIVLPTMSLDPRGEWVRYVDVPKDAPLTPCGLRDLERAERERDAAREAQRAAEDELHSLKSTLHEQLSGYEAELRSARANLAAERANSARAFAYADLLAKDNLRLRKKVAEGAAPDDAWCYDMAAAPRDGAWTLLAFAESHYPLLAYRTGAGDSAWYYAPGARALGARVTETPYAWRRILAPPRP